MENATIISKKARGVGTRVTIICISMYFRVCRHDIEHVVKRNFELMKKDVCRSSRIVHHLQNFRGL